MSASRIARERWSRIYEKACAVLVLSVLSAALSLFSLDWLAKGPPAIFVIAAIVVTTSAAVALISLLVATLAFLLSAGFEDWLATKALRRKLLRLPMDARLILDAALANYGTRVTLPTKLAATWTLVEAGHIDPIVTRSDATIFRVRRDLVPRLQTINFVGQESQDIANRRSRIFFEQQAASAELRKDLSPTRVCIGPVAHTKVDEAWRDGRLPWRLTPSFPTLERVTRGLPVVMDRRTWDALPERPLPDRLNIVITRSEQAQEFIMMDDGEVAETLDEALIIASEQLLVSDDGADCIHIIGGPSLVKAALPRSDLLHLTEVEPIASADIDQRQWREIHRETIPASGKDLPIVHRVLERIGRQTKGPRRASGRSALKGKPDGGRPA